MKSHSCRHFVVGRAGIEPATLGLKVIRGRLAGTLLLLARQDGRKVKRSSSGNTRTPPNCRPRGAPCTHYMPSFRLQTAKAAGTFRRHRRQACCDLGMLVETRLIIYG